MRRDAARFPRTDHECAEGFSVVSEAAVVSRRFPDWPFSAQGGHIEMGEYDLLLCEGFASSLERLAEGHGDQLITVSVLDPDPAYYGQNYGFYPLFWIERPFIRSGYWEGISYEPEGDPTGAILYTADVIAVTGDTQRWVVWGQRDWGMFVIRSEVAQPDEVDLDIRRVVDDLAFPYGNHQGITNDEVQRFARSMSARSLVD